MKKRWISLLFLISLLSSFFLVYAQTAYRKGVPLSPITITSSFSANSLYSPSIKIASSSSSTGIVNSLRSSCSVRLKCPLRIIVSIAVEPAAVELGKTVRIKAIPNKICSDDLENLTKTPLKISILHQESGRWLLTGASLTGGNDSFYYYDYTPPYNGTYLVYVTVGTEFFLGNGFTVGSATTTSPAAVSSSQLIWWILIALMIILLVILLRRRRSSYLSYYRSFRYVFIFLSRVLRR